MRKGYLALEYFPCDVCGDTKHSKALEVYKHDLSDLFDLEPETMIRNVRYCATNSACLKGAMDKTAWIPKRTYIEKCRACETSKDVLHTSTSTYRDAHLYYCAKCGAQGEVEETLLKALQSWNETQKGK